MAAPILVHVPAYLRPETDTRTLVAFVESALARNNFKTRSIDTEKPWGVEIKLRSSPARATRFLRYAFGDLSIAAALAESFTPKILLIKDAHRLSWHVHERKDAHLRILHGRVGVSMSSTDKEPVPHIHAPGDYVHVPPLMRHRLASLNGWAVVAEIGCDTIPDRPSDDADMRRIQDDYGR